MIRSQLSLTFAAITLAGVLSATSFNAFAATDAEISAERCTDLAKATNTSFQRRLQAMTPGPVNPVYSISGATSFGPAINGILSMFGAPQTAKSFMDSMLSGVQAPVQQQGFFSRLFSNQSPAQEAVQTPGFNPYQR